MMATPTPEEITQELLSRGVPAEEIARVNPSLGRQAQAGMLAPRLRAPDKIAERGAYIRDYGQINKDRDDLARVYPVSSDLERFHQLNMRQGTGGWQDNVPLVKDINNWLSPKTAEMAGIASTLQGKARPVGSGATSDFEQRLYRQGVPSPEKRGDTNGSIIAYQKGVMAEESDRLAFQEEFLRRNGSLSGSQEAWGRYVAANPYTLSDPRGRSTLNARRTDWREHFGVSPPSKDGAARAGQTTVVNADGRRLQKPVDWAQKLPPAQRNAARMFQGASAASGAKANPYVPTSAAEFGRLPAGSWYIDDDGKVYQKGGR